MAKYDYVCPNCGKRFEVEHRMSERPVVTCPDCGTVANQVFSTNAIVFQGSGFYNTDERGSGKGGSSATPATSSD